VYRHLRRAARASDCPDYLIDLDARQQYVLRRCIRFHPALTSGMAVAAYIEQLLADSGKDQLTARPDLPAPPRMPNIGEAFPASVPGR